MTDSMKTLNEKFTKISNQIEFQIQQYEQAAKLTSKKIILDEIKMKFQEEEFNISASHIKSEYRKKIKSNFDSTNFFKSEIFKFESLSKKMDQNLDISRKKQEMNTLGEVNNREYSYTKNVKNNAEQTYYETKNVIKNLDNEMKLSPLIDRGDMAYGHYNTYNSTKSEMKEMQKKVMLRRLGYFAIVLIILAVIFLIAHKSQKVEDIEMDETGAI